MPHDLAVSSSRPLRGGAFCAGGGGLELSLHIAIPGYRTVVYVEREAYAAATLVARMADAALDQAPVWDDVATFNGRPWRGTLDILSAGYPCQPFSHAGRRRGADDPRHLWPHIRRIIVQSRPWLVWLENVPGHLTLGYSVVRGQLEALGFIVAEGLFSAQEVGASHRRERLFILAYAHRHREAWQFIRVCRNSARIAPAAKGRWQAPGPAISVDRRHPALAFACGAGLPNPQFQAIAEGADPALQVGSAAFQLCGPRLAGDELPLFAPGPAEYGSWLDVLSRNPSLVPAVRRASDGMAHRVDRLRIGGNGVVPLAGALAFSTLAARLEGRMMGCHG
ncbi:DNA cytosine methyltransferase [Azospirillum agricola]|uniref:DNA cytosine methyltransferase n=1 Tax=Azospirillum agricola TaxID=1720247 RepID=UPI000A1CABC5|nr:DNA cytosine methyltransferase [Azospirillum agricola]